MKKLSIVLAGVAFSTLSLGLKTAQAHGGHLHPDSGHLPSDSGQSPSSIDPRIESNSIFYGEARPLGNGLVRTWVRLNDNENPTDIGVSFTDSALFGLPGESDDVGEYPLKLPLLDGIDHSTFEYELLFPKEAEATPFTHLALNWNPSGHAPEGVTTVPHFDFHFNLFTPEERHTITADNLEDFLTKAYKAPPVEFLPPGYIAPPMAAEPRMGVHYIDPTSPEFQRPFDRVFIYGSYDGKMAFWEPMVANSFLLTKPNTTDLIKLPSAYPKSGYYPTAYSVNYANGEYSVSLNGLKYRSVPEPSLTLGTLAFGAFSAVSFLNKKRKQTA
ncbi:DUF5602 domain-containing protein [Funiculus sociatus]|uniref:DUF5602 domain-containing protein n=1 Tax=Funiculus sociatus TaxID=450527 RepID=UPI003299ACAB